MVAGARAIARPPPTSPHRPCFAAAALLWALTALAWALVWAGVLAPAPAQRAWWGVAHALLFGLGVMPLFIAGFLFTAGARWLRVPPLPARRVLPGLALAGTGWAAVLAALVAPLPAAHLPAALAVGLLLAAAGWMTWVAQLLWLRRAAGASVAGPHFTLAATACGVLTVCLGAAGAAVAAGSVAGARAATLVGLWWGVAPVFLVAGHRLLPFFGHGLPTALLRRWPRAEAALMASGLGVAGAAAGAAAGGAAAPPALSWALVAHAALLAGAGAALLWHWRGHPALRTPLTAMFYRALGAWTLAWMAQALSRLPLLAPAWQAGAAAAAQHLLVLGWLGGTMLAMVTRVTATQAGRARAIDALARALEALLQAAVLARVLAEVPALRPVALALAAAAWAAVAVGWLAAHARDLRVRATFRGTGG